MTGSSVLSVAACVTSSLPDGHLLWQTPLVFDPAKPCKHSIDVAAHAGTAFDGRHLFQIAENRIQKIDPETGRVLATNPRARRWR
jgi:hypothetical protein